MRILEARFHPRKRGHGDPVVVGLVVCDGDHIEIRPVQQGPGNGSAVALDEEAVLAKLRFLIDATRPSPAERLPALVSDFWSFEEVK